MWKKCLIDITSTLKDAIEIVDKAGLQIGLVVTNEMILKGTITDGDIRRAILKGAQLHTLVSEVMNKKPKTAFKTSSLKEKQKLLDEKKLRHLPIVDGAGVLIGLEMREDLEASKEQENWVVLMAGGLGQRLRPLTQTTPKPLLKVGSRPILETIIQNFERAGFKKIFISINYMGEQIENHFGDGSQFGVQIQYLREDHAMGTAGSLKLLPGIPNAPLFVMNGDILTNVDFARILDFHTTHKAKATLCVRKYDFQVPYGVVSLKGDKITSISEKPTQSFFVNAGIYVIEPELLKLIPDSGEYHMPQIVQRLNEKSENVLAFPIREYWLDIGRVEDFHRANGEFDNFFGEGK